jgi:hypothetical protein
MSKIGFYDNRDIDLSEQVKDSTVNRSVSLDGCDCNGFVISVGFTHVGDESATGLWPWVESRVMM